MSSPYTSVSVSGYNSSPPEDDGSQVASNQVNWSKHKLKLGDPLKTAIEAINTNVQAAFTSIYGETTAESNAGVTPTNYQYAPGNVLRYGTNTTPGTTDMTAAIQAAIDSYYKVFIPAGTYKITTLNIPTNGRFIYGEGWTNTILESSTDAPMITKTATSVDTPFVRLESFRMTNTATLTNYMIDIQGNSSSPFSGPRYSSFRDLFIVGDYGMRLSRCWVVDVEKVRFSCDSKILELADGCNSVTFSKCVFQGGDGTESDSMRIFGSTTQHTNVVFNSGCTFEDATVRAYMFNVDGLVIRDCYFEPDNTITHLLRLENCPSALIEGNRVRMGTSTTRFADILTNSADTLLAAGRTTFRNNNFQNSTASMAIYKDNFTGAKGGTILQGNSADSAMPVTSTELFNFKTADETIQADTTLSDDAVLAGFKLSPGVYYAIEGVIRVDPATTSSTDLKFTFQTDNAFQESELAFQNVNEDGTVEEDRGLATDTLVAALVADKTHQIRLSGFILANASSMCTVDFQWAQNASFSVDTTVQKGSWIRFSRLQ